MNSITRIPLPATRQELLAQSEPIRPRNLYYGVADIHLAIYEDLEYQKFLNAYTKEHAVEGSIAADEFAAASMIRAYAVKHSIILVQFAKLNDIIKALRRVMRDGHISRKERREMAEAAATEAMVDGDADQ